MVSKFVAEHFTDRQENEIWQKLVAKKK